MLRHLLQTAGNHRVGITAGPKGDFKMKRLSIFSIVSALLIAGTASFAQSTEEPATQFDTIDSVAVTAARVPVAMHSSARIVTLMDSTAIASTPAENVNDLLKYALGVDVRQRGAMGMQTDISMRGGTYNQIAVLLDGINITDPQTGHNSADFPVNLCDIDHIEVLEGPASRVYGTSSLVGAVNIVTKKEPESTAAVNLEGGSFGYANASASLSLKGKRGGFNMFSAGYQRSDGFNRTGEGSLNSDYGAFKAFWHGSAEAGGSTLHYQAGVSGKDFGSSTFYSTKFDNQFEHTFKTFTSVKAVGRGPLHFTPALYWNRAEDRFELIRGRSDLYPFNHHRTNTVGLNLGMHAVSRLGRTAFGLESRYEGIRSTNLGEVLENPKGVYVCGTDRAAFNLYLEHNVVLGPLSASVGATGVYNTGSGEGFRIYPGADFSLRIVDALRLYASYNTSYRMPTFTELYYSVGGHKADPNLKAEKLRSLECGLKFLGRGLRAVTTVYYNRGYDMIDWIRDISQGDDSPWTSVNHTRLNTFGQEISLRVNFPDMLRCRDFFLRSISLGYSHISQSKALEENLRSMYSMEYIRNKVVAQADVRICCGLTANISYRYIDRRTDSELIKPYSLLDAKLAWDRTRYNLYLRVNNLLDREYYDFGEIPQPGLWIMAGATFRIF